MDLEGAFVVVGVTTAVSLAAYAFAHADADDRYHKPSRHWKWVLWYGIANTVMMVLTAWFKILLG